MLNKDDINKKVFAVFVDSNLCSKLRNKIAINQTLQRFPQGPMHKVLTLLREMGLDKTVCSVHLGKSPYLPLQHQSREPSLYTERL